MAKPNQRATIRNLLTSTTKCQPVPLFTVQKLWSLLQAKVAVKTKDDQLIYNVLNAGTTVYRPNNKSSDTALVGSDVVTAVDLIEVEATLNGNGARPYESGYYAFVTSPQPYAALLKDPDFKAAAQFRAPEKIWRGEVGELYGFRVIRSNSPAFAATSQAGAGQSSLVYSSLAIGRFAYQISDLQNLRVYVVAPGGQADPLQQSRKIGQHPANVKESYIGKSFVN